MSICLRGIAFVLSVGALTAFTYSQPLFPTNELPPPQGVYVSPADYHVLYANGVIVKDIRHFAFTQSMPPPPPGPWQQHVFGSMLQGQASFDGGLTFLPFQANAQTCVRIRHLATDGDTELFETEMIQLDISGGSLPPQVRIRESPTLPSLGGTRIRPDAGEYRIDSFFDVFTELTVDGGTSWVPALNPGHVVLIPEPGSVSALVLGLSGLVVARRRSRK